jgi:hypothetical protein
MKNLLVVSLIFGLLLSMSATQKDKTLYQVITSHPHDLEKLKGLVETVYQEGRLWIVDLKEGSPLESLTHLKAISGREKSYLYKNNSIRRRNLTVHHFDIRDTIKLVDAELIKRDVEDLASYTTRAAGTDQNREATKSALNKLADLGYAIDEVCYRPGVCSVIANKKGSKKPDEVMIVLGHLDSVGHEFAGADDNASGTAVLLEMARVLKDYDNHKTIRFFVTNGEELGLLGAKHYVGSLKASDKIKKISLAINMDMVGYNKNGVVELETSPELEPLANWYADLASRYTKLKSKITLGAWGSDHVPFLDAGVPAILTMEDWSTKTPCYHLACDTPDTLNYDYAADIGRLNLAALMTKDRE